MQFAHQNCRQDSFKLEKKKQNKNELYWSKTPKMHNLDLMFPQFIHLQYGAINMLKQIKFLESTIAICLELKGINIKWKSKQKTFQLLEQVKTT